MSRIDVPSFDAVQEAPRLLLEGVDAQLGFVPNIFMLLARSPAALQGYLGLATGMAKALDVRTRERISLAIAQANGCDYCLSAHNYLARHLAKLDEEEIVLNRHGRSNDARADAAVRFAVQVVEKRGRVSDADLAEARLAGLCEAQIVEITVVVAMNLLTNYLNEVAQTGIDFPIVHASEAA